MNTETAILSTAIIFGAAALAAALFCLKKHRETGELLDQIRGQLNETENSLAENKETLETVSRRAADQARRIAWLESRLQQPRAFKKETAANKNAPLKPARLNITERRHRVLSLAASGQSTETIAAALGMLPGEVDLIINLNRASFAQFG